MSATYKLLRFGVFELNLATEELRKEGIPIKLAPQPFQLLALLASHSGQVVTRDEVQKQLWDDDTFVDFEQGMNKCIKQIRNVLNDNAEKPLYIETIPRHGYRFLAPVVSKVVEAPPPKVTESASGVHSFKQVMGGRLPPAQAATAAEPARQSAAVAADAAPSASVSPASAAAPATVHPASDRQHRKLRGWWAGAALALIALVAFGTYWRTQRASALTDKDTIILADFDNTTGSPVFDAALREALTAELEQSPYLNVLPPQKVREQLRFMGQPVDTALKEDVARQICQRTGSKAMLMGSISSLGSHYPMALRAENCNNGDVLAIVQEEAENREQVVKKLNKMGTAMRAKLGESLASIQKYDTPIEQATTASLEALQAYSSALKTQETEGESAAIPFYKHAIELDSNFAMAYDRLGAAYGALNQPSLMAENLTKAFELRERTTEKEKQRISASYYLLVTGDLPRAIEAYRVLTQTYQRDSDFRGNLAAIYFLIGKYQEALHESVIAQRLNPMDVSNYVNSQSSYIALGRFAEAKQTLEEADSRKLYAEMLSTNAYMVGFLTNDADEMKRQVAAAIGRPGAESQMLMQEADTEAYFGRIGRARIYARQATDSAARMEGKEVAATWQLYASLNEAEIGYPANGLREALAALAIMPARASQFTGALAALALARSGDTKKTATLAGELGQKYPSDTLMQFYWLPAIRAASELDANPQHAIDLLRSATPYELGAPPPGLGLMYPVYLRGLAFMKGNQPGEAAVEFRKILDHKGIIQNFVTGALANLQLARALAMSGDRQAARKSYQDFLELWKDADQDVPVLIQAKAEYAKLK